MTEQQPTPEEIHDLAASFAPQELDLGSPVAFFESAGRTADQMQRQILTSPARRLIVAAARQGGKSEAAAARAAYRCLTRRDETVLMLAPTQRQAGELLSKARRSCTFAQVRDFDSTTLEMRFATGSRIIAVPASAESVAGYAVHELIIDEAGRVPDSLWETCQPMLAATAGTAVLISTPYLAGGFFESIYRDEPAFDPRRPEAEQPLAWEKLRYSWQELPRISPLVVDELRRRNERAAARDYDVQFVEDDYLLMSRTDVEAMFDPDVEDWSDMVPEICKGSLR
jgi:hypothetical protein